MTEWLARLKGDVQTLELLKEHLAGTNYSITKDKSSYYLKVADLPEDTAPAILQNMASRLIELLNGAAKLYLGSSSGLTSFVVVRVNENGMKEGVGFLTLPERSTTLTLPPILDGTLETWICLGTKDESVARALTLYGALDHNWKNLYMVLEVIEEDAGSEDAFIRSNWIPQERLKIFKRTANSFRAIEREARHGKSKFAPPLSPMSLEEAQELIKELFEKWMESKGRNSQAVYAS
jgi:hypothetical protein